MIDICALVRHSKHEQVLMVEWCDGEEASCGWWDPWHDWHRETLPVSELQVVLGRKMQRETT